jgi:class 3 adenylate cyclase
VRNTAGNIVAVLYVGSSKDDLVLLQRTFRSEMTRDTAIAAGAVTAVIVLVSVFLLLSIRRLQRAVVRMKTGEYGTRVSIRRRDEIGDLGESFNVMGESLQGSFDEISSMSTAYARFVPKEFLELLEKEKITEVELKQNRPLFLTILFADIRSFTSLSEKMEPDENFKFLNSFLSRMGPLIRRHHGFIDKFIGDGIMALFPGEPSDGVASAVDMQREMYTYNRHRKRSGYEAITIGIGVHAENVILGVVGEQERMEGTVIGDAVNLAARLEGLTKRYGSRIIVSDQIIKAMGTDAPDHRYLGDAEVKGKRETVPVHEVFGADPEEDVRLKRHTKGFFETGVGLFRQGERRRQQGFFSEAYRYFKAVQKAHPADLAAKHYRKACESAAAPSLARETPAGA